MTSSIDAKLTVCIATIHRPECVLRLLRSIRQTYPTIRVIVGEQVGPRGETDAAAFGEWGAEVVPLPFDSGVCAARNEMAARVTTPYFVINDDDFVWSDRTKFERALAAMDQDIEIAVVGGKLFDIGSEELKEDNPRHWERWMFLDEASRQLALVPIESSVLRVRKRGEAVLFEADAVMNFAIVRKSAWQEGVRWDEQFKSNGEHEDFFLHIKRDTPFSVAYCPDMIAFHYSVVNPSYSALRDRVDGWRRFSTKWGVETLVDGKWKVDLKSGERRAVNSADDIERAYREAQGYRAIPAGAVGILPDGRLYAGPDLRATERQERQADVSRLNEHIRWLEEELKCRDSQMDALKQSTSWRVTAPLRALSRSLGR